jgi:AcrR family transcriptional regulator
MATMPAEPTSTQDTRTRVLDAAMRLLDTEGPDALQVRRIAAEAGSSTMAVYTHFGSMVELRTAVVSAGLRRFAAAMEDAGYTDDPIADLFVQGVVYRRFALANPHLYRMMFGVSTPQSEESFRNLLATGSPSVLPEGAEAFAILAGLTERAAAEHRITVPDTVAFAAQVWCAIHGYVLLEMAGYFGDEGDGLIGVLAPMTIALLIGAGDERERVDASFQAAIGRFGSP